MHVVVPGLLWTGNAREARSPRDIADAGIQSVVDVAIEEEPAVLPRTIAYCRVPLHDGASNDDWALRLSLEIVASLISDEIPTLVACSAGVSRSPSIAIGALAISRQSDPDEELRRLAETRSLGISPALWLSVVEACTGWKSRN